MTLPRIFAYVGPMYAGKTDALIDKEGAFYKLTLKKQLKSQEPHIAKNHGGRIVHGHLVSSLLQIRTSERVILVDEFQFAHISEVGEFFHRYADREIHVAGLNLSFDLVPFEVMGLAMCHAESIQLLSAKCHLCGKDAQFSRKLTDNESRIDEGDHYIAVCRSCHDIELVDEVIPNRV